MPDYAAPARKTPGLGPARESAAARRADPHRTPLDRRAEAQLAGPARLLDARAAAEAATAPEAPTRPAGPQPIQRPAPNRTGLPDRLKAGVEALSGLAMDDVRVHRNSSEPAKLGALAYAQGGDIHVGPGQERHLPHEAWHVIQQKQGRVRSTRQSKGGSAINDDDSLEREADAMGAAAQSRLRQPNVAELQRGAAVGSQVAQRVLSQVDRQIYDTLLADNHGWQDQDEPLRTIIWGIIEEFGLPENGYWVEISDDLDGARGQTHPPDAIPLGYPGPADEALILLNATSLRNDLADPNEGFPRAIATVRHEIQHVLNLENGIGGAQGSAEGAYDEVYGHTEAILNLVGNRRAPDISREDMIRNYRQALGYFEQLDGSEYQEDANDRLDFCLDKMADPPFEITEIEIDEYEF